MPAQTREATLWELAACIEGHNRAHGAEDQPEPPTSAEFDDLIARHAAIIGKSVH